MSESFGVGVTISGCYVEGRISGIAGVFIENIGGLVGYNEAENLLIQKCYTKPEIYTDNTAIDVMYNSTFTPMSGLIGTSKSNLVNIAQRIVDVEFYAVPRGRLNRVYNGLCYYFTGSGCIKDCIVCSNSAKYGICSDAGNMTISNCLVINKSTTGICGKTLGKINNCFVLVNYVVNPQNPDRVIEYCRITGNYPGGNLANNYAWSVRDVEDNSLIERNGLSVSTDMFWGASTQSTFWANPDKLNWDFDNIWEFREGYYLPQLRYMPSIQTPNFIE